ncbi:3-phosphoserine/phosphohydroxythreonine aminotransferase [Spirochaetia bacterium]|nr:3-phosphoserine/phosphohydroxythreonine aminotransferase [Spirochaetia bacterium]
MLPLSVLQKAAGEITSFGGAGQSVMEISHRGGDFKPIIEGAESLLRELLNIPPNYHVLFLQGGGMTQFAAVPVNIAGVEAAKEKRNCTYIDTGVWAAKAASEAGKYVNVKIPASSKDKNYTCIPDAPAPSADDAYYYICLNNTIVGTKWHKLPETGSVPLVTDASSCILSEPLDVTRFGLIFAGAQKNLGPAGCTIVIVRDDIAHNAPSWTPAMLNYDIHIKEKSLFNTPPCWCIYIIGLVLQWIKETGGLAAMQKHNSEKAALLYDCLDNSKLFKSPVEKSSRSLMNVPFVFNIEDAEKKALLEKRFLHEAALAGMVNLAGHRLVGGLRASIYNAMPVEGVRALISFINQFEKSA